MPQYSFASVLATSTSLHTLIDVVNHGTYGKRMSLTTDRAKPLLEEVLSLTRVVSENRLWTVRAVRLIAVEWLLTFEFLGFQFPFNSEPIDTIWSRDTPRIDEEFTGNWLLVYTAS